MRHAGFATADGTARFRARFESAYAPDHWRDEQRLWMSSIGIGTYLGAPSDAVDAAYRAAIERFVGRGGNVIDTAINYRCQRSERNAGQALDALCRAGLASRDEIVVATKGGFIPFDGVPPRSPRAWLKREYVDSAVLKFDEIAADCHCMSPRFLSNQIERSLSNLGLETIDVYYLHNPETQLDEVDRETFRSRLARAFEALESATRDGKIRAYGAATWEAFRCSRSHRAHLDLDEVVGIAREAGGPAHHFRFIQLPVNVAMPEALLLEARREGEPPSTLLETARRLGITVMASASLLQGRASQRLPERVTSAFPALETHAQRAIQFTRSAPGLAVALVGMSRVAHVEENLATARVPRAEPAALRSLYGAEA